MKLFLCGGGSGEKTNKAYKKFYEMIDHNKPLLYVPLALEEYSYDNCLKWITNELSSIGITNIEMVRTFKELANKDYFNYSAIFIGGGNTFRLLKGFKDSGAFDKINEYINNDGVVYGGSAGAIIFGYDINNCLIMDDNEVNLKDTKGFNVLDGKSLCAHYTNEDSFETHEKFKQYLIDYSLSKENVIALPEEDTIFINDDSKTIIGYKHYYEFENGIEIEKRIYEKK